MLTVQVQVTRTITETVRVTVPVDARMDELRAAVSRLMREQGVRKYKLGNWKIVSRGR
jgi:hypothetical protein